VRDLDQAQGRERGELGGLQDDCVGGGQGRRDFPRHHQEREVPGTICPTTPTGP